MNYFLDCYKNGFTPNPCVRCNRTIKFGKLLEATEKIGASFLATGHYVKVVKNCKEIVYSGWEKFDFPDINVEAGRTYFLVCTAESGSKASSICWNFAEHDWYHNGMAFFSKDQGDTWWSVPDSDCCFKTYYQYDPPLTPQKPMGKTKCRTGVEYQYSTITTDPDPSDEIYYMWDWGDGNFSEWLGPYYNGENVTASHTWYGEQFSTLHFDVKVKAKDRYVESEWSEPLSISVPRNKPSINALLIRFLDNHPCLFPILTQLL